MTAHFDFAIGLFLVEPSEKTISEIKENMDNPRQLIRTDLFDKFNIYVSALKKMLRKKDITPVSENGESYRYYLNGKIGNISWEKTSGLSYSPNTSKDEYVLIKIGGQLI